ncbi:hypothetical protein HY971_03035 [Candidatus Kaiserbacteria bacterium]|nr:hypothetical protein [Candidatus Kaiserbacteria bacterium]
MNARWGAELFISTSLALGNAVVYFAYLGYIAGASGIWFQIAWCAGFVFIAFFAERIAARVRNRTIHSVLGEAFGTRAAQVAALATVTGFTLNLGWELVAGFSIFSVLNLSPWVSVVCILLLAGGAAFYTAHGGMRGNLLPNRAFNIMSYVSLVLLVIFLALQNSAQTGQLVSFFYPSLNSLVVAVGLGGVLTNILFSILWQFVDMSGWQNLAATTTEHKAPVRSLLWSSLVLLFIPGVAGISIGMLLRNISGVTADNLLPSVVTLLSAHPILFVVIISGLIAAMLSTIDGFLLASANTIVQDIFGLSEQESEKGLKIARTSIVLLALLGATIVFFLNTYAKINLYNLVYVTYSAQLALFPAVMAILLGKKIHAGVGATALIAGIFGGLGVALYASFTGLSDLLTWAPLIGLAISGLLVVAGWFKARTT